MPKKDCLSPLCVELDAWFKANPELTPRCALETLIGERENLSKEQVSFLEDFVSRWEEAEGLERTQ